jgi:hypothetical protein
MEGHAVVVMLFDAESYSGNQKEDKYSITAHMIYRTVDNTNH